MNARWCASSVQDDISIRAWHTGRFAQRNDKRKTAERSAQQRTTLVCVIEEGLHIVHMAMFQGTQREPGDKDERMAPLLFMVTLYRYSLSLKICL